MKYAWIDGQRREFSLAEMCMILEVSVSGYRAWKRGGSPNRKRLTDAQMLALIRAIHTELKGAYGSPRMVLELRARGFSAGKERVERLRRENGIHARHKRRYKVTTDSKHGLPVAPNLLDRNFTPEAPDPGLGLRHHLPVDKRGLAVSGHCARPVQPRSGGLVAEIPHDGGHRDGCADHGVVPQETSGGADAPLRPGKPICQSCLSGQARRVRHGLLDEPQGQLLG